MARYIKGGHTLVSLHVCLNIGLLGSGFQFLHQNNIWHLVASQVPATNREVTFKYAFMYIFDESIEILTLANLYLDIYEGIPKFDLFYT